MGMSVRIALLLSLALWAPAWGACAPLGKLCTPSGASGNNPACCAGLSCPATGSSKNHCVAGDGGGPVVTTTIVSGPHPTTSTPTSTTPPATIPKPLRYDATDVGLRFPDSQEVLWEPRTGLPANQYQALVRLSTIHWELMPELLRLMRDTPACGVNAGTSGTISDMVGKFFILYSLRPMRAGGTYPVHPNYLWDLPQGIFRRAAQCLRGTSVPLRLAPLLATGPAGPAHRLSADRSHMGDGLLDPRHKFAPLAPQQCQLLHAAHTAHQDNGDVFGTQRSLEAAARDPFEQTLLMLIFTGSVDPKRSAASVAALTEETKTFHKAWMDCMHCDTGAPPDLTCAWGAALGHARAHFLRAVELPGLLLRTVCPGDIHYCPETDS